MGSSAIELAALTLLAVTFHRDVEPILHKRCVSCHRPGEIGPMPFLTYARTRPWAKAIRDTVVRRKMPPWFADRTHGRFANDPSLTDGEIAIIRDWVDAGAPEGDRRDAPRMPNLPMGWKIPEPDLVVSMPKPFVVPAKGDIDYQYAVVPLNLTEDRWVQMAEARPGARSVIHHIVVYIREPGSEWLRDIAPGQVWAPRGRSLEEKRRIGHTTSDVLLIYAPGSGPMQLPEGMAKRVKAGSDLVLQIHYTPNGRRAPDQTRVGLVFAKQTPARQVLTLQMGTDQIRIPPGDSDYRLMASGTLPNDALLLSFFPHMHLRGKSFEYRLVGPNGRYETLLKIPAYDFYWQMSYVLAEPRLLRAGERLQIEAHFDNSANNPRNPDPTAEVVWGEQSWGEMMIGFFDVAVDPSIDKQKFFERTAQ